MRDINTVTVKKNSFMVDLKLPTLVAIGTSAGGPGAILSLLKEIPKNFLGSIVIIQHFESTMSQDLISWWQGQSNLPVKLATPGIKPEIGTVYVAGGPEHLIITKQQTFALSIEPKDAHYSPSVDQFFLSTAKNWRGPVVGVLLTGMGDDGARGLLALRRNGHLTIAQSKESSAIFGMPKAAMKMGSVQEVVALPDLANRLHAECKKYDREKLETEKRG